MRKFTDLKLFRKTVDLNSAYLDSHNPKKIVTGKTNAVFGSPNAIVVCTKIKQRKNVSRLFLKLRQSITILMEISRRGPSTDEVIDENYL